MKNSGINWDDIAFLESGKHRKTILKLLENPSTPTEIKERTNLHFNSVSRTINELEKNKLVECLTPSRKLHRIYRITERGKKLLTNLK